MEEQITLDSWLNLVNKPKPKYAKGDIVYYVKVDRVHKCSVKQTFEVKKHFSDDFDDYRHNLLELDTNNNFQTGEKDFGATLFDDYESAKKMADYNSKLYPHIQFSLNDVVYSFREMQKAINWKNGHFDRYILLLNDNTVIYKNYMCYTFSYTFESKSEAEKFIKKIKKLFQKQDFTESQIVDISTIPTSELLLYFCTDNKNQDEPNYATLDYFYNHYFKNNYAIN